MSMVANRADFDAFMERCDQRLAAALDAARAALSAGDALRDAPAPAVDERIADSDSGHLAAAPKQHGELPEPVAWAAGTECNARGFIDVMAWSEGEFTVPLYTADQLRTAIAAERAAHAENYEFQRRKADLATATVYQFHYAMKDAGWHPGRADDNLCDIIRTKGAELSTLRQQLAEAVRERDALRAQVDAAVPAMRDYARRNPRWESWDNGEVEGKVQDPNGVNAWLEQIDAASKGQPT